MGRVWLLLLGLLLLLLLLLFRCLLQQAFSPRYFFSRNNGDPHCSGCRFQTAVLSVLCVCVMFHVQLSFCSECIECFPGMAFKFLFKTVVTIMVTPIVTAIIVHFMFHIHCISIHELPSFGFFSASFY